MTCKEKYRLDHPDATEMECNNIFDEECPCDHGYADAPHPCTTDKCLTCWDRDSEWKREETTEPIIKDSGDRTRFESGAVRDMREGKGRCDLMPLEVMARMYDRHDGKNGVLDFIKCFMKTNSTHFLIKALDRFALDTYGSKEKEAYATMFLEVAKHFEEGAKKYGESNWQKGIPVHCYIDSAVRHYLKWLRGDKDEPHDRAFVWNIMCCIWEVDYHKE